MIEIRLAAVDDLPQMRAIYAPYVRETTFSFEYRVPTPTEFAGRFARITAHFPWLVAEEDGEILGYAYGDRPFARAAYAWDAESSIYIRQDCLHRGLGAKLYRALEPLLAGMGFVNLYAVVTGENINSIAFHEHMGYRHVATIPHVGYKFGRWHDTVWLLKILREESQPGAAPILAVDMREC